MGEQTPNEADPDGTWYCFEKRAKKTGGGDGWADVWKKECFGWKYKGKGKDPQAALKQLQGYALALQSPPLLIVSDLETIIIHTAFTNAVQDVHVIPLENLGKPEERQKLKWALTNPEPDASFPAIAEAARRLNELRENWLNPPAWVDPSRSLNLLMKSPKPLCAKALRLFFRQQLLLVNEKP